MIKSVSKTKLFLLFTIVFFATNLPRHLGVWEFLFGLEPAFVGLYPWTIRSKNHWKYSFEDLYEVPNKLNGQHAIVTGANSGIGYEISLALARLGATVTMACRNPQKCEQAALQIRNDDLVVQNQKQNNVHTMMVDVSSLQSVRTFCELYRKRTKNAPLDMLFFNAAIKYSVDSGEPKRTANGLILSENGIEQVFATNVVGHHLMYKLLSPSIYHKERTTPARIVQTSSAVSYLNEFPYKVATDLETLNGVTDPQDPNLYHQAKLAQILWAKELSYRGNSYPSPFKDPNSVVYVNSANPGAVATKIWHEHANLNTAWSLFNTIHQTLMWTPEEAALTLLYLGTVVEDVQQNDIRGQYFHPQATRMDDHVLFQDGDNAQQTKELQENMWDFLDELVRDFV